MRIDRDSVKEIFETLSRNRSRTFLTGFGIFWGIFMLLTMLGGGNGLKALLGKEFEGFASNTIVFATDHTSKPYKGFKKGRYWDLNVSDVQTIRKSVPDAETVSMVQSKWGNTEITYGSNSFEPVIKGLSPEYADIETPRLMFGRYINEIDLKEARKVCILGERVWRDLFPDESDPVGLKVRMMGTEFTVIGVDVREGNLSVNGNNSQSVVIPFTLLNQLTNRGGDIDCLCLTVREGCDKEALLKKVEAIIRRNHTISPDDKSALKSIDTQKIFAIVDNLFKGVNILVILCGLGTLLAGAIGVSNIMLVTVKERTTEIGIRRAIGATPKMILGQILAESMSLTLAAGMIGILVSVGLLGAAGNAVAGNPANSGISFQIGFWTGIGVLALIALLGLLAGLIPAMRAMSIKPVDAMRED